MPANLDLLFRNHHGELKRMAYGRLGDREAAADVVQDAFLRYAVMAQSERQAAIESPRQFLWRIVQNLIIDMARRRRRRGEHVCIDDVAEELADPAHSPERSLELEQQWRLLRQALAELPPNCRQALLLNRLDGLTHAEIAAQLGVSASMVSKYIMQALRHCHRRLGLS